MFFNSKPKPLQYQADVPKPYKSMANSFIAEDVEASNKAFGNDRFHMIIVAAQRMRDLQRGDLPMVPTKSKPAVTALLEIAAGKVTKHYTLKTRK